MTRHRSYLVPLTIPVLGLYLEGVVALHMLINEETQVINSYPFPTEVNTMCSCIVYNVQ